MGPPGQVTDLTVVDIAPDVITVEFTAPGDDLDSNTTAAEYIIKYSATAGNLTGPNFDLTEFNTLLTQEDLVESTLEPVIGGTVKQLKIKTATFEHGRKYIMAMRAKDEVDNYSPVSNKGQFCSDCSLRPGTSSTTTTTTTSKIPTTTTQSSTTTSKIPTTTTQRSTTTTKSSNNTTQSSTTTMSSTSSTTETMATTTTPSSGCIAL